MFNWMKFNKWKALPVRLRGGIIIAIPVVTLTSTLTLSPTSIVSAPIPIRNLRHTSETTTAGVVRSVVGNQFILDDGTGQLIVDLGLCWNRQNQLTVGEKVTVVGEYDDFITNKTQGRS